MPLVAGVDTSTRSTKVEVRDESTGAVATRSDGGSGAMVNPGTGDDMAAALDVGLRPRDDVRASSAELRDG